MDELTRCGPAHKAPFTVRRVALAGGPGPAGFQDTGCPHGDRGRVRRAKSPYTWSRWQRCFPRRPDSPGQDTAMSRASTCSKATGPTSGAWMKIKMGATNDGKLVAADATLAMEAGAFPGFSGDGMGAQCLFACLRYRKRAASQGYDVVDNKPQGRPLPRPRRSHCGLRRRDRSWMNWPEKLGMDPLEFRLKQRLKRGHPPGRRPGLPP